MPSNKERGPADEARRRTLLGRLSLLARTLSDASQATDVNRETKSLLVTLVSLPVSEVSGSMKATRSLVRGYR